MARSKPTRKIELTYAAYNSPNNSGILYPCFIGPRYRLHKLENGNTFVGVFTDGLGVASNDTYINEVPYPNVMDKSIIDTASVQVNLTNAVLQVADDLKITGIKEGTKNCLVFEQAVAGAERNSALKGYDVRPGDLVTIGDTTVTITDVRSEILPATVTVADITGNSVTGIEASGTYTNTNEAVYVLTVTGIETETSGKKYVIANVNVATGDLEYGDRNAVKFEVGAAEYLGNNNNIQVNFSDAFTYDENNNVLIIRCTPEKAGEFVEVYVNNPTLNIPKEGTTCAIYTDSISKDIELKLSENYYTVKPGVVVIDTELSIIFGEQVYSVQSADVQVEYRELLTQDAEVLVEASADNFTDFVGEVSPENPLGFMSHCGRLAKTEAFYVIATADTTDEAYIDAINVALKYENVFALITYKQTDSIRTYLKSKLREYNAPEVAQFRKLWFADDTTMTSVVYDKTATDDVALLIKMDADGKVTFLNGDVVAAGVRTDDTLVIPNYYNAQTKTYTVEECVIKTIIDKDELIVKANSIKPFTVPTVAYITRKDTRREYAINVGSKAAAENSAYINYVWADNPICQGFGKVEPIYLCATLAALRSAKEPHAPLSEVAIPGWTVSNEYKLSEAELDIMNDKGVWIVYTDRYGETVTRHQLTTVQDMTIAEEDSAVSNACNIVRSLRSMLYRYRGIANVTNDLTAQLKIDLISSLEQIRARKYSYHVGPQVIDYKINELGMDPDNAARIMVDVDIDVPEPLLDGNFKFNIV